MTHLRRLLELAVIIFCVINFVRSLDCHNPHFWKRRAGIVHLFEWKFKDIADECERFLAPNGYGGVQISPPNENVIIDGRPWYERYQPISYNIISRSGNEEDFLDMTTRCNAVGVRIFADAVFNHMAADQQNFTAIGTGGSKAYPSTRDYPVPYSWPNFHYPPCEITNYNNANEVRNCELVGLHDLNQTMEDTRSRIVSYLNHLIDLGVAGFRIDAAKHMWPSDLFVIYNRLKYLNSSFGFPKKSRAFIFQEVIDLGGEAVKKTDYNFCPVTEFKYSAELGRAFRGNNPLKWFEYFGELWGLLPSKDAVVFICNHDSERSGGDTLTYKMPKNYKMAQAFSLAYPFGIAKIMSSYAFDTRDKPPPADDQGNIISPTINPDGSCGSGWICEHRWKAISSMVKFKAIVEGTGEIEYWWTNDNNQIAFSRGNRGFIVFNLEYDMENVTIQTSLPPGKYCDIITGNLVGRECTGKSVLVKADGTVDISLSADDENGIIAIHVEAKITYFDYFRYSVTGYRH